MEEKKAPFDRICDRCGCTIKKGNYGWWDLNMGWWFCQGCHTIGESLSEFIKSQSVNDEVIMYAVRKIGKNVPFTGFTYFIDEAETWMAKDCEIVTIKIKPLDGEKNGF